MCVIIPLNCTKYFRNLPFFQPATKRVQETVSLGEGEKDKDKDRKVEPAASRNRCYRLHRERKLLVIA